MGTPNRRQPGLDLQSRIPRGGGSGYGLLGQDVERQHRDAQLLDPARDHVGDGHDRGRQLPAVQGVEASPGGRTHPVPGPAETLQRTRSGQGGADLDHLVDGAHVDAQLQGARGHDGPQPPRLERVLDLGPDVFADRTVVGASQVLAAAGIQPQLVEASRQFLRRPAGVREHQRGPGPPDRIQDLLLHVGPGIVQRGSGDPDIPGFPGPGSHHDHVPVAPEEGRHLFDGTHGGGQGHTPHVASGQQVQALQTEGQVGAALGTGDGVDLVDYHRLDVAEGFPGRGREHQIQRLGCGDQHIRWPAPHSVAVAGRGVARAHADGDLGNPAALPPGLLADSGQRDAQVAFHIHPERLQRGDVDHPRAPGTVAGLQQGIEGVQEGRQGLPGAGRRHHQDVTPVGDGPPRPFLHGRRRPEGVHEPVPARGGETAHRHAGSLPPGPDRPRNLPRSWLGRPGMWKLVSTRTARSSRPGSTSFRREGVPRAGSTSFVGVEVG